MKKCVSLNVNLFLEDITRDFDIGFFFPKALFGRQQQAFLSAEDSMHTNTHSALVPKGNRGKGEKWKVTAGLKYWCQEGNTRAHTHSNVWKSMLSLRHTQNIFHYIRPSFCLLSDITKLLWCGSITASCPLRSRGMWSEVSHWWKGLTIPQVTGLTYLTHILLVSCCYCEL